MCRQKPKESYNKGNQLQTSSNGNIVKSNCFSLCMNFKTITHGRARRDCDESKASRKVLMFFGFNGFKPLANHHYTEYFVYINFVVSVFPIIKMVEIIN